MTQHMTLLLLLSSLCGQPSAAKPHPLRRELIRALADLADRLEPELPAAAKLRDRWLSN
jgi:hypothetical protein